VLGEQGADGVAVGGVDAGRDEPGVAAERGHRRLGPRGVVVGDHEVLEEGTAGGDTGHGGADRRRRPQGGFA